MIRVYTCVVCKREYEYGDGTEGPQGYDKKVCSPICDGIQAGRRSGRRSTVNRFRGLALALRAKGNEHGDTEAGLAFEAAASSIERVCDEVTT